MITINGKQLEVTQFPNMESLIKTDLILPKGHHKIGLKFESETDLIHLYMIKSTIDYLGGVAELYIPYMPYSRMDRVEESNFCFTLRHFAKLINDLNFVRVTTMEAHSDVTLALFDRITNLYTTQSLFNSFYLDGEDFNFENKDYVVFPDTGAEKRYSKQIVVKNTLCAIKHRDFETGFIKSLDIIGNVPSEPFKAVIIDDLCSKGGTFILTANKLKELGATEVHLIVSHCENTMYDGDVLKKDSPITKIIATNSILNKKEEGFKKWNPQYDFNKLVIMEII